MRYAVGIDGGGTKCDAAVIADDGTVVGWGRGGPTHTWYETTEVIANSYSDAICRALQGVSDAELWIAGGYRSPEAEKAIQGAGEVVATVAGGEIRGAYAAARKSCGIIILAGTGSFVHVRTPDGRDRHAGGLGPVLGDYGSAYEIGLAALRAAFASTWFESRDTSLVSALPQEKDLANLRDVFSLIYDEDELSRRDVASLAKIVDREAQNGDAIAAQCIREVADDLADLAVDLIHEMSLQKAELPVIASGSVARKSELWWKTVTDRITDIAPLMRPIVPKVRLACGVAMLALEEMGVDITPEVMARIEATQHEHLQKLKPDISRRKE